MIKRVERDAARTCKRIEAEKAKLATENAELRAVRDAHEKTIAQLIQQAGVGPAVGLGLGVGIGSKGATAGNHKAGTKKQWVAVPEVELETKAVATATIDVPVASWLPRKLVMSTESTNPNTPTFSTIPVSVRVFVEHKKPDARWMLQDEVCQCMGIRTRQVRSYVGNTTPLARTRSIANDKGKAIKSIVLSANQVRQIGTGMLSRSMAASRAWKALQPLLFPNGVADKADKNKTEKSTTAPPAASPTNKGPAPMQEDDDEPDDYSQSVATTTVSPPSSTRQRMPFGTQGLTIVVARAGDHVAGQPMADFDDYEPGSDDDEENRQARELSASQKLHLTEWHGMPEDMDG